MLTPRRRAFGGDLTNVLNGTATGTPAAEKGRVSHGEGCETDFAKELAHHLLRKTAPTEVPYVAEFDAPDAFPACTASIPSAQSGPLERSARALIRRCYVQESSRGLIALLAPPPAGQHLAEGSAVSAPETDAASQRAVPAGLKRRRPLISGAPLRMVVASPAEEPPHKRQSLGNEPPPCPAQDTCTADSALDRPAIPSAPEVLPPEAAAAPTAPPVASSPAPLPAGFTVRRKKSRMAPKPAPSSVTASSTASRLGKAPVSVPSGNRRHTLIAQVAETAAPASHSTPGMYPAALVLALLPSPGMAELSSRAAATPASRLSLHHPFEAATVPASRLSLQLPAPSARRASVVPSAAPPPAARRARSRQSISFFHRECVPTITLLATPPPITAHRGTCTGRLPTFLASLAGTRYSERVLGA